MLIPVNWSFERKGILPLVEVRAESQEKAIEPYMIHRAVEIIDRASQFKGIPYQNQPSLSNNFALTISFSLFFPSNKEATSFMEAIRQENSNPHGKK